MNTSWLYRCRFGFSFGFGFGLSCPFGFSYPFGFSCPFGFSFGFSFGFGFGFSFGFSFGGLLEGIKVLLHVDEFVIDLILKGDVIRYGVIFGYVMSFRQYHVGAYFSTMSVHEAILDTLFLFGVNAPLVYV